MADVNSEILDQAEPKKENKDSYVQQLREAQEQLCNSLISSNFNFKKWLLEFNTYIKNYDRFFYSTISNFILSKSDDKEVSSITQNITDIISKVKKEETLPDDTEISEQDFSQTLVPVSERNYKLLLKFLDHCNLATIQRAAYNTTKENIKAEVNNLFDTKYKDEYDTKIKPKLDYYEKNITTQLISLISIFTALSFVIFGSISILDNLLVNIRTLPIFKVIFIGNLWLICMTNIFTLFARMISKFISQDWKLSKPLIICNTIMICILIAIIIIYAKSYGINGIFTF